MSCSFKTDNILPVVETFFFLFMFIGSISKTDMLLKLQHLKYELDKDQKRKK